MGVKIIKCSAIIAAYIVSFGLLCPTLVSASSDEIVIAGLVAVVLTVSTIPAVGQYVMNLFLTTERTK